MEPEPTLRAAAERAAADAPVPVRVMPGVADDLPLEDASADAVVASLVIPRSRPRRLLLQGIARRP